ncbi:hypothetical protein J6590_099071 [Homalodisca vitripennis]|nr:hypothetical protein J6590_099071 [Homalodisca vitripennis]
MAGLHLGKTGRKSPLSRYVINEKDMIPCQPVTWKAAGRSKDRSYLCKFYKQLNASGLVAVFGCRVICLMSALSDKYAWIATKRRNADIKITTTVPPLADKEQIYATCRLRDVKFIEKI